MTGSIFLSTFLILKFHFDEMSDNSDTGEESNDSDDAISCDETSDNSDNGEESNDSDYEYNNQKFYN